MNWMFLALVGTAQADDGPGEFTALRCDAEGPALPAESERALNSAVRIETDEGTGSGFFISPDGLLLTAAHVVEGEDEVNVVSQDGSSSGTVLRVDSAMDLALVRVDASGRDCLRLAEGRASVGSDVFVIGSPGGEALSHSMTRGIVSGYREVDGVVVLQTDASINAGVSGGPVVSAAGDALGVVSYKLVGEGMEGLAFAVASEQVGESLGLTFGDATDDDIEVWRNDVLEILVSLPLVEPGSGRVGPRVSEDRACKVPTRGEDPFTDVWFMEAHAGREFSIRWDQGYFPLYTARFTQANITMEAAGAVIPGAVGLSYLLEDGTKVHMRNARGRVEFVPSLNVTVAEVDFILSWEAIEAMARSGPVLRRWSVMGNSWDEDRSERQGEKFYRPYFSCLAYTVEAALPGEGLDVLEEEFNNTPEGDDPLPVPDVAATEPAPSATEQDPPAESTEPTIEPDQPDEEPTVVQVEPERTGEPELDSTLNLTPELREELPPAPKPVGRGMLLSGAGTVAAGGAALALGSYYADIARTATDQDTYDKAVTAARASEGAAWALGAGGVMLMTTGTIRYARGGEE